MQKLVDHFAEGIRRIDASCVPFKNFKPGVGPYGEPQLVKELIGYLRERYPNDYAKARRRRTPDFLVPGRWAVEIKIVRPFGDNGKEAEHWSQNLVHPYEGNVSLISDAYKLLTSGFVERKGLIAVTYSHDPPEIDLEVLVRSFEKIVKEIIGIQTRERYTASVENLIHPIHQRAEIYGWELLGFQAGQ